MPEILRLILVLVTRKDRKRVEEQNRLRAQLLVFIRPANEIELDPAEESRLISSALQVIRDELSHPDSAVVTDYSLYKGRDGGCVACVEVESPNPEKQRVINYFAAEMDDAGKVVAHELLEGDPTNRTESK